MPKKLESVALNVLIMKIIIENPETHSDHFLMVRRNSLRKCGII